MRGAKVAFQRNAIVRSFTHLLCIARRYAGQTECAETDFVLKLSRAFAWVVIPARGISVGYKVRTMQRTEVFQSTEKGLIAFLIIRKQKIDLKTLALKS